MVLLTFHRWLETLLINCFSETILFDSEKELRAKADAKKERALAYMRRARDHGAYC